MICSMAGAVGQFGGFLGPVLGEEGDEPIRQDVLDLRRATPRSGAVLVGVSRKWLSSSSR